MKIIRTVFAIFVGFIVIYLGSIDIPGTILPFMFGPYPEDGNVAFSRVFADFCLSFLFTIIGGYLAAKIAGYYPVTHALVVGVLYFCLSAYFYSTYGLSGSEWITPSIMLIKVPLAAFIGGYICKSRKRKSELKIESL